MRLSCAENPHVLNGSMVEILDVSQYLSLWCVKSWGDGSSGFPGAKCKGISEKVSQV